MRMCNAVYSSVVGGPVGKGHAAVLRGPGSVRDTEIVAATAAWSGSNSGQ